MDVPVALISNPWDTELQKKIKDELFRRYVEKEMNGVDNMVTEREWKAEQILKRNGVSTQHNPIEEYRVTGDRGITYIVTHYTDEDRWSCTCPDHVYRERECKHIKAVKKQIQRQNTHKIVRKRSIIFEVEEGPNYKRVMGLLRGMEDARIIENPRDFVGEEYKY